MTPFTKHPASEKMEKVPKAFLTKLLFSCSASH